MQVSAAVKALHTFMGRAQRLLVVTGAGVSTDSGIPDYRSKGRPAYNPIQHGDFVASEATRRRYWARSMAGFQKMSTVKPNPTHQVLARLEAAGRIGHIITQNVDRLHQSAGSRNVLELHGTIHTAECLSCGQRVPRGALQRRLLERNASLMGQGVGMQRPDGDVELADEIAERFQVAPCHTCGGILKPSVVFFGGTLPAEVAIESKRLVEEADAVLAVGTTLSTFSAFRLFRAANEQGKPIAILNDGPTRADGLAALKIEERCAPTLLGAEEALNAPR